MDIDKTRHTKGGYIVQNKHIVEKHSNRQHVIPITYDTSAREVSWNFDDRNKMYLSVDEACTIMNFVTTCGNRPRDIRHILLSDNVAIHGCIDELQAAGF